MKRKARVVVLVAGVYLAVFVALWGLTTTVDPKPIDALVSYFLNPLTLMTILVVAAAACVITSTTCRRRLAQGRNVSFWSAVIGAFTAALGMIVLLMGDERQG